MIQLRYFFEYASESCLWLTAGANKEIRDQYGFNVNIDKLPLLHETKAKIFKLSDWFQDSVDWGNPGGPSTWTQGEADRFNADAEALFIAVKAELVAEFEIIDSGYKVTL